MFEASINQDAVSNAPQEALDIVDDMKLPGDKPAVKKTESAAPSKTPLSEMMANKRYSTKFKNLAKKWAANEWVNIDLNKDSQDGYDFLKFAAKWYNGGRENLAYPELRVDPMFKDGGDRFTLVYDDRDTDYPNFLIDVFYKAGKAEAPKTEPVKAEKPAEKKPEQSKVQTPSEKLAGQLLSKLDSNTKFTSSELFDLADEAFGGTQSQGTYTVKDAYDALELAVNKRLLKRMAAQGMNSDSAGMANLALKEIGSIMDLLPTQTKRTAEQESFQQFSTPPNIAYLAAWAARISNNDFILEPSAGIGGLAVFAKAWGAEVAVNELSARRLEVLRAMGFDHMFNENAEQIDNILPDNIKPTVVIMNPPFSATAGRTASNKTSNAIRHIEQALSRLEPNGRLVAILGRGMADDTPTFRGWWNDLRKKYNIRANIGIDGSNYTKYGTSFDVQLVVIDKTGPQTGDTLTGTFKDLGNIPNAMEGIRNDRPITQTTERKPVVESGVPVTGTEGQRKPESATVPDRANTGITNPETDAVLDVPAAESAVGDGKRSGISEGAVQPTDNELEFGTDGRAAAQTGADAKPSKAETDGSAVREPSGQLDEQSEFGAGEPRTAVEQEIQDDGVFSTYVSPNIPVKAGKHPAVLVESSAMAAVSMPEATYVPKLPKSILKNLSTEQMVAITYAGQAFAQKLPTGEKKGFFVGDGTGVGKGRTISGIIADSFAQGQKKAVWITKSQKLLNDAIRDWGNTTGKTAKGDIIQLSKIKADAAVDKESGILFASFDTLRGGSKTNAEATRIKQIIDWLGADFDGVIVYDEAHNMANLVGKKTNRGKSSGSAKAIAGVELQRKFPNAGIVYTTATAAQEVSELAFAERLGLWGQGTPFADVNDFINSISSSGLAAMELVSREMKERGLYVARSISYEGVEYQTIKHNLDDVQREIYDTMSRAWQKVMQNVNQALEITDGKDSPGARAAAKSAFYGAVQRFYNQVLTSMSMPSVIRDMKAELENNRSIVIQIVTTNEAEQERQLGRMADEDISLEELDMTPRGALINYLEKSFPINQYEDYTDDNGNNASRPVFDSHGKPVINKEAVKMRDALIAEVQQMKVPQGPLEMLFDSFGTENVAEMTGRKRRVVPKKNDKGQLEYVVEKLSDSASEADAQAFQDGRKHILVFSDAGGTGKSYHADRTAKNQQQRVHYVLQPGWSAKNAVQGFGRTHRTNEASAPIYKLVTTDIKGQKRFVSTIARRLDQLGALTKGQRETGSGIFSSADNLESAISIDSLREFYNQLLKSRLNGLEPYNILEKMGLLDKFTDQFNGLKMDEQTARNMQLFLNRILALEVDEQNRVFENFELINSEMYEAAKEAGTLDEGLETIKAEKIEVVDDQLVKEYPGGGSTRYVQTKVYNKTRIEKSLNGIMAYRNNFMGLYKLDNGETRAVFRVANKTDAYGNIREQYRLMTPNLDGKYSTWNESTLQNRAALLDKKEWAAAWKAAADEMPEYNTRTMHLLTGSLLPVWDKLPMEGNIKVVRMNTDDGQSLLGRVIKPEQVDMTLNRMGYGRKMKAYSPSELFDAVLKENKVVKLEFNRISIQRSRVNNEQRLEIKGDNLWSIIKRFPDLFMEKIQYRERYFIPNSQVGRELIGKIVDTNRVTGVYEGEEDIDYSFRRITSPDFLKTEDKLDDRQLLIDALDETSSENQYSDRDPSRLTSREQLATAFEGISHTEADKQIIAQYKGKLEKVEADVQALREINAKIKELSFAPGKRDMDELARLKNNKVTLSNRIARNDSMLTRIENAQPMRQLISYEKRKAENAIRTQEAQRMAEYRERMEGKVKEAKDKGKENLEKYKGKVSDRGFRADIQEIAEDLTNWINSPDKNARVPQVLRRVIGDFLLTLNLQSKRAISGGDSTKADRELYERMNTLALTLTNINAFQNGEKVVEGMYQEIAGFFDMPAGFQQTLGEMVENIRKLLEDSSGDYVINRMTGEELEQLHYILKILRKSVTQMNKLLSNAAFEHVDTLGNRTIAEMELIKRDNKKNGTAYRFFNWENTMPVYAFDRFGTGGKAVFESLQNGADRLSMIAAEIKNYAEKTFTAKESREWSDELHTFNLDGEQVKMTTWHLMGLYSMSQREQAKGHLYGEGIRVGNFQHKGQTISSKGHTLTPGKVQAMIGQLTARQKDVADKLQRFMNDRGGELGNQVTMVRFGVDMYEEQQYYPLESDKAHLASDTEGPEAGGLYRLLNLSFSKKLQKKANNRVMLYSMIDVFANHMSDMAQYNALALPVLDAVKWLNYQESITTDGQKLTDSVKDVMRDAFGDAANSYITHLLKDINGTRMTGDENAFAMKRLRAFNRAQVAANLRVALLQPLSIVRAGMVLSPGSITKGMLKNVAMLKKNMAEMDKYAGIAQWKQLGFYDVNLSRSMQSIIKQDDTLGERIADKSMWLPQMMDRITWAAIWQASKDQTGNMKDAAKLFRDTIYRTQVVDSILTRSDYMRNSSFLHKWTSSFMSEPTLSYNIVMSSAHSYADDLAKGMNKSDAWKKNGKKIARAVTVYAANALIVTVMQALMSAWRDDDDYSTFGEKFADGFKSAGFDNLNVLNLPLVNEMWEGGKRIIAKMFPDSGIYGFDNDSVITAFLDYFVDAVDVFTKHFNGDKTSTTLYGGAYKLLQGLSVLSGYPLASATREVTSVWNNTVAEYAPSMKILTYTGGKHVGYENLYKALQADDEAREEHLRSTLSRRGEDDKGIYGGLRDAVREDFKAGGISLEDAVDLLADEEGAAERKDIYKLVKKWEAEKAGNEEYKAVDTFIEAVRTGKNLRAVISEYMDAKKYGYSKSALASAITEAFKDEYLAASNYERARLKGYLLNAYVLLGYDRDDKNKDIDAWLKQKK